MAMSDSTAASRPADTGGLITVSNEFGTGQIAFTVSDVMQLLERAVWLADDLRRYTDDPLNTDWVDDADSLTALINYERPAAPTPVDD